MNKTIRKTAIVFVGILLISISAGNILFAGEETLSSREPGPGIISTTDIKFVAAPFSSDTDSPASRGGNSTATTEFPSREPTPGLISAADVELVSRPFADPAAVETYTSKLSSREPGPGVISAADIGFVGTGSNREDQIGRALLCEASGVQASNGGQGCP